LFLLTYVGEENKMKSPFEIPPSGKPDLLVGNIEFEAPTGMAFDSLNRPYLINNRNPESFGQIRTLRDGKWVTLSCVDALKKGKPPARGNQHANGELVFDDVDCLYAMIGEMLVYSADFGASFHAYPCRGSLEVRVGHNRLSMPPAICQMTNLQKTPGAKWGSRSTLSVILPEKTANGLKLGAPIRITDNCLIAGSGGHSGGTSFAISAGRTIHLVYAEMPATLDGGNPTYIATIDRETRTVIAKKFLVKAEPEQPDVHSRPTIAVDSKGYLHVVSGSHGQPFRYLRSLRPDDITGGWTKPVKMTSRQTYASLVCDARDRLHSVFRQWAPHATLGYKSKAAMDVRWERVRTLVHGALERGKFEYGIFYHRLFIDRASTLYLNFTFFEFNTDQDGDYPEALAVSEDSGKTWQLADKKTIMRRITLSRDGEQKNSPDKK
jgi:hypothetical protein